MSIWLWLQRLVVPKEPTEDDDKAVETGYDEEPFVFTQHLRVILAIIITIVGAGVMWWIMA